MANKYTALPTPPKKELEYLYHKKKMSQVEVGKNYRTTQKVVFSWFVKLGIKSRVPKKRNQIRENNSSWKGDKATYAAFHYRVESLRGKPMQCSVCGSQDTTFKTGISKSGKNAGKPWRAYDCNEPKCKNEKGYPSRTFAPSPKSPANSGGNLSDLQTIMSKIDRCLAILQANFKSPKTEIRHEDIPDIQDEPF